MKIEEALRICKRDLKCMEDNLALNDSIEAMKVAIEALEESDEGK